MPKFGMVIDLDRCMGCRACVEACKIENNTPRGSLWMHVFRLEQGEYPNARVTFLPRPCMHCDDAPCVKVCPVGARFKRDDGLVATDPDRCIGCRYCEVACPYGVNVFNWSEPEESYYLDWKARDVSPATEGMVPPYRNPDLEQRFGPDEQRIAGGGHSKGVMEKCTFCVQRLEKDLPPACVANCPVGAMAFGDLDDPNSAPSRLLQGRGHFRLLEEVGTEPRVIYVGGQRPGEASREVERVEARS